MDLLVVVISLSIAVLGIILEIIDRRGANRITGLGALHLINEDLKDEDSTKWGTKFKNIIKQLGAQAFNRFKIRGIRPVQKHEQAVSRGFDKLSEICSATKVRPKGEVLSLCCGRGGWEQVYSSDQRVTRVTAVTFGKSPGREGHEDFTNKYFPGKEKVNLRLADARTYPITEHDTLLFDGGESHPDYLIEARRFNDLFANTVMRQISPCTKVFIVKVLTPTHPETLTMLRKIQSITNKGSFYRPTVCKNANMEMYFISTTPVDLTRAAKAIIRDSIRRGIENRKLESRKTGPNYTHIRETITPKPIKLLEPLDMTKSIEELGEPVPEQGRAYNHWENHGVYPIGVSGSKGMKYNKYGMRCASRLVPTLKGFDDWKLTDTTPEGFIKVFNNKIDIAPVENHPREKEMLIIYEAMAHFYKTKRNFRLKEMSWEELEVQANKQGAPGFTDVKDNIFSVGEFLRLPDWRRRVEACRKALREGKPIGGIFNTMGKREKKESMGGPKGSRMIAYLGIAMRLLEMKLFGNLLKLTKAENTRFGVGGLGLHDLGERLNQIWKGSGICDDIAGFDTRIGLYILSLENHVNLKLGGSEDHQNMYRLYAYPHIVIPVPSEFRRSQLLSGRGQRMSGTQPTYTWNTLTRIAVMLLQASVAFKVKEEELFNFVLRAMDGKEDIGATCSGDDIVVTSEKRIEELANSSHILDEVGMTRKNVVKGQKSLISYTLPEVEFCSHHYEKISFYDSYTGQKVYRYMATRRVTEIVAKSLMRIGASDERDMDAQAWISAQGNNLCMNYPHLRTCRALGLAYKSIVSPRIILTNTGGFLRPRPWMQPGDLLEILNNMYFGTSTNYPVDNFKVRQWSHVGYMSPKKEVIYDKDCFIKKRAIWRDCLLRDVETAIYEMETGGDTTPLDNWRIRRMD
nr:NS5 [Trichopteran jingmen-related virus]